MQHAHSVCKKGRKQKSNICSPDLPLSLLLKHQGKHLKLVSSLPVQECWLLCSVFASHLSWEFIGSFEVPLNKQGLCVSLIAEPTLRPWFHRLLIKCLVISVSTFRSCLLCKHLERISSQASVTYPFCGSRESCVLGDVVALNKLSLWFLTVKGTLVNINRQRESKAIAPI